MKSRGVLGLHFICVNFVVWGEAGVWSNYLIHASLFLFPEGGVLPQRHNN